MPLKLLAVLVIAALPAVGLVGPTADVAANGRYDRTVNLTFPVAGPSSFIDDYNQVRGGDTSECLAQGVKGRRHQATDVMAKHGQRVHAAVGGTITFITGIDAPPPNYGYMITIRGTDGLTYNYIHLGRNGRPASEAYASGMRKGVTVQRGQHIGFVGSSGNASESAPHLHFEIIDPSMVDSRLACPFRQGRINPVFSLRSAQSRGDLPTSAQSTWRFSDVAPGTTHHDDIVRMADLGITVGCGDGSTYCPNRAVTRAEMATFIVRAKAALQPKDNGSRFTDVPQSMSHRPFINALADAGITNGCGGSNYCPTRSVTRAEMASFLVRSISGISGASGQRFADVPTTHTHVRDVNALADAKITNGCGGGNYCPTRSVTRAEMASFIARALDRGM